MGSKTTLIQFTCSARSIGFGQTRWPKSAISKRTIMEQSLEERLAQLEDRFTELKEQYEEQVGGLQIESAKLKDQVSSLEDRVSNMES